MLLPTACETTDDEQSILSANLRTKNKVKDPDDNEGRHDCIVKQHQLGLIRFSFCFGLIGYEVFVTQVTFMRLECDIDPVKEAGKKTWAYYLVEPEIYVPDLVKFFICLVLPEDAVQGEACH